jgi:hypothetical protein
MQCMQAAFLCLHTLVAHGPYSYGAVAGVASGN